MKTEFVAFRATEAQRQKLELLAMGERTTLSGVISKLIDDAPVIEIRHVALAFNGQKKTTSVNASTGNAGGVSVN